MREYTFTSAHLVAAFIVGLLLAAVGFAGGLAWAGWGNPQPAASPTIAVADDGALPTPPGEVPGDDVAGLPRFPGSSRVEYRQVMDGDLMETEVEYVVAGELDVVHNYYRTIFDEQAWKVADLGVYQGEWTFFVLQGEREALLEIESRGELIEIEIEISEPLDEFVNTEN